jgi:hypothetical protein
MHKYYSQSTPASTQNYPMKADNPLTIPKHLHHVEQVCDGAPQKETF